MNKLYHLWKLSIEQKVLNRINMFFRLLTCWSLFQKPPLGSPECPLVIWRPEKAITFTLTCTTYTKPFFKKKKYIYSIYKISTNYFITLKVLHCYINKCYIDGRFRQQSAFKNIIFSIHTQILHWWPVFQAAGSIQSTKKLPKNIFCVMRRELAAEWSRQLYIKP